MQSRETPIVYTVKVSHWVRKQAEIQVSGVEDMHEAEKQALDKMDDIFEEDWSEVHPCNFTAQAQS